MTEQDLGRRLAALEHEHAVLKATLAHKGILSKDDSEMMRKSVTDRQRHGIAPSIVPAGDIVTALVRKTHRNIAEIDRVCATM
jgi:hypothetical protein